MRLSHEAQSILVLLKLDANRLFRRLKYRAPEYLVIFSLKRNREHFKEIFKSRYDSTLISELKLLDQEIIIEADRYFGEIDDLKWYLYHTEDLPGALEANVNKALKSLEPALETLNLYIDAQLGYQDPK